jgi:glycine/D-amino acid oxidase-like deaminating enzyme
LTGKEFDVVVVGAGILGMSSAYHLQKNSPNRSILVVDRFVGAGQGNTGRSNAMFRNTFTSTDNQTLSDTTIDFYLHLQTDLNQDIGLEQIGYLWLMSERQIDANERYVQRMVRNSIEVREYGNGELKQLIPGMRTEFVSDEEAKIMKLERVDGALFGVKCGRLDPEKLVGFYRDRFLEMGGKVAFNTDAVNLMIEPDEKLDIQGEPFVWQETRVAGLEVRGALEGEIKAGTVVAAAGAWGNELLEPRGIDGHVKAKKRQLFAIPARKDKSLSGLLYTKGFNELGLLPMVILPTSGVHFKPVRGADEFWIGCEDEVNRPFLNAPEHDLDAYKAESAYYERNVHPVLKEYFPHFKDVRPERMWAGLYSYNTIDFLPFVVPSDGLIVVGGDSGSGIMKGDALGRIVDSAYRGGEGSDAMLYGEVPYRVAKLGFEKRDVEREEWVI